MALRAVTPELGQGALAALRVPGVDPLDVALPSLLNDLTASSARHVLILDDYHVLTDVRIHEAVEYLLAYLPPSLRLVVAARFDPPLPLPRMRARGQLTEIRAAQLRFTSAEAGGLVSAVGQVEVGAEVVDALVERTEGWAAGLKLAALTIRRSAHHRFPVLGGARSPARRPAGLPGPHRGHGPDVRLAVRRGTRPCQGRSPSARSEPSCSCRSTRSRATARASTASSAPPPAPRRSNAAASSA
jgi:hypothetical protein